MGGLAGQEGVFLLNVVGGGVGGCRSSKERFIPRHDDELLLGSWRVAACDGTIPCNDVGVGVGVGADDVLVARSRQSWPGEVQSFGLGGHWGSTATCTGRARVCWKNSVA